MKLIAIFIAFAVLSACSGQTIEPEQITSTRTYAYKSIAGVSMGGGAAAAMRNAAMRRNAWPASLLLLRSGVVAVRSLPV